MPQLILISIAAIAVVKLTVYAKPVCLPSASTELTTSWAAWWF